MAIEFNQLAQIEPIKILEFGLGFCGSGTIVRSLRGFRTGFRLCASSGELIEIFVLGGGTPKIIVSRGHLGFCNQRYPYNHTFQAFWPEGY